MTATVEHLHRYLLASNAFARRCRGFLLLAVGLGRASSSPSSIGTAIDATALEAWITQFGPWAPIVFFCAYVLATVLFLPGLLFTLAAGALFGPYRRHP